MIIDVYSRMIIGWHIGFDKPGCLPIAYALRHAITPKTYIREKYPDIPLYDVWGVPTTMVSDIGSDFVSNWFKHACAQLKIDIQYCPAGAPKYKAKIERFFRTMAKALLHKMHGSTFSNVADKGDQNSAKRARYTLAEVNELLHLWIITDYAQSLHRGINDVPMRRWKEGVKNSPPILPPRASDLTLLLAKPIQRTLQRHGIEYLGLLYVNDFIGELLRRFGRGTPIQIRVDLDDLNSIYLHDTENDEYVKIPSADPEYTTGLTHRQHVAIREYCARRTEEYINISELLAARAHLLNRMNKVFHSRNGQRNTKAAAILHYQDRNELMPNQTDLTPPNSNSYVSSHEEDLGIILEGESLKNRTVMQDISSQTRPSTPHSSDDVDLEQEIAKWN
jgi:putative transposase